MDPTQSLLIIVLVINLVLVSFLIFNQTKTKENRIFIALVTASMVWVASVFIFRGDVASVADLDLIARIIWFSGVLIAFSFYTFSYEFLRIDPFKKNYYIIGGAVSIFVALTTLFTDVIIAGAGVSNMGIKFILTGEYYFIYPLYYIGFLLFVYAFLGERWIIYRKQNEDIKSRQILHILLGTSIPGVFGLIFNIIMPAHNDLSLFWLGPIMFTGFTFSIAIAAFRYNLFNIKALAIEIFTFIIWILVLLRTIFSNTFTDLILNTLLFVITVVIGIFVIRTALKEYQIRERLEQLTKELNQANIRLKELDRMKTEFLSIASHQFRSPLTAIKGYTSNMLDGTYGDVPEKLQAPIDRVFTSADHLALIVDDFLNLSRIEQGRMDYEMETVNLKEFVESAVDEQRAVAEKKGIDLSFKTEGEDFTAKIDRGKFKQVITNLIDNALKYTPEGSITVALEASDGRLRTSVSDTGVGVPKDEIDTLFGQFKRATNANNANVIGTGLGLYIAKKIVEAHKGEIWVESEGEGKGSTFIVEIPQV